MIVTKAAYLEILGQSNDIVSYWLEGGFTTALGYRLNSLHLPVVVTGNAGADAAQAIEKLSAKGGSSLTLFLPILNRSGFARSRTTEMVRAVAGAIAHEAVHVGQLRTDPDGFKRQAAEQQAWVKDRKEHLGPDPALWDLSPDQWLTGYYREMEIEAHAAHVTAERLFPGLATVGVAEATLFRRLGEKLQTSTFGQQLRTAIAQYEKEWT